MEEKFNAAEPEEFTDAEVEAEYTETVEGIIVVDKEKVEKAINKGVYAAMGIGVTLMPILSLASVTAIQLNMVRKLSEIYGVDFKENKAKKIIAAVTGAGVPVLATGLVELAVIGIPVIGTSMAFATMPALNGISTNAVGRMFVTHFERNGDFVDANIGKMKEDFSETYKNSKEWVGKTFKNRKAAKAEGAAV